MKNQKIRSMKVHEQSGYNYKATPTIILKGQWLKEMGFEIEASHHEVAPAQHEIDFKYDEVLKTEGAFLVYFMLSLGLVSIEKKDELV